MEPEESDLWTLSRVAKYLGISAENLRALEKRGRLPDGCDPEIDLVTGTRGWTAEQVEKLKVWNDERLRRDEGAETIAHLIETESTENH